MTAATGKRRVAATSKVPAIHSEKELDKAIGKVRDLMSRKGTLSAVDKRIFSFLLNAIEEYETVHHLIPDPPDAGLLAHLLDAKGHSPEKLAHTTGIPLRKIQDILAGKCRIERNEALGFAKHFHVENSVFGVLASESIRMDFQVTVGSVGQQGKTGTTYSIQFRNTIDATPQSSMPVTSHFYYRHRLIGSGVSQPVELESVLALG